MGRQLRIFSRFLPKIVFFTTLMKIWAGHPTPDITKLKVPIGAIVKFQGFALQKIRQGSPFPEKTYL